MTRNSFRSPIQILELQVREHFQETQNTAFVLLRFTLRKESESGSARSGPSRAPSAARDLAVTPFFLKDEDFATMIEDIGKEAKDDSAAQFFPASEKLEAALADDQDSLGSNVDADEIEALRPGMKQMDKVFSIQLPASVNSRDGHKIYFQRAFFTR